MKILKLENIEAIAILSIIVANKIILNLPKSIISTTGSSAWLNTIYVIIIAFIFILFMAKLLKKFPGKDIIDVSEFVGRKNLKNIVGILYILFIISMLSIVIRNFSETLKMIYFNQSPIVYIMLFLIAGACLANKFGIKVIAKATLFIAPIIFLSLLIILLSPARDFVIQRLFPILGYGFNETFLLGISNIYALVGLGFIFLLPPLLKNNKDFKKITLISLSISAFYLLLSISCLLLIFSFVVDKNESMSPYLLTLLINYGNFIQGANTLFVLFWILSVIAYISIDLFFILYIIKKLSAFEDINSVNYSMSSILLGISMIAQNYSQSISTVENVLKYALIIFIFMFNPLILIIGNIKNRSILQENNTT